MLTLIRAFGRVFALAALVGCVHAAPAEDVRPVLSPLEILRRIQGFRSAALDDQSPLDLCAVDAFWTASGDVVAGQLLASPAIEPTRRSRCPAPIVNTGHVALLTIRPHYPDSLIVSGSTRRGRVYRLESYAFVPSPIAPSQWRLEYRITQFQFVDAAPEPSL